MSFPLVGNERIKDSLFSAIKENRLPHAVLIEGDKGVGKKTLSKFLSLAAVCSEQNAPCGNCRNCHLAGSDNHPDITVISPGDGKKNITVAQIRSLRNEAYVKPHMSYRRVFVITQADTMNEQAQNALLKVLEEPPGAVIFILIAEAKAQLLDTVISRCTVLSLVPPEIPVAIDYISSATDYSKDQIKDAVALFGGNIGDTLDALGGGGTKAQTSAAEFLKALLSKNEAEMLKITLPFEKNRVEADMLLKEIKLCVANEIKKNYNKVYISKQLSKFLDKLPSFEASLKTNINLSLLFCSLVSSAAQLDI